MTQSERGPDFGADYYARSADRLGWGPGHAPDAFKLSFLAAQVRGSVLLDVACGPGLYAAALAGEGRRVVGADFSHDLLRAHRSASGWRALCASGLALPLRDGSVDTTLLLSILEHVDDLALLREVTRVTRARLIIQVPLAEPPPLTEAGLLFSHWVDKSHVRTYTEPSLRALAASAGWHVIAFVPAYHRDLHSLYLESLAVPKVVRKLMAAMLRPVRRFAFRPAAEAFVVAEKA